jgi:hypothetical protein
MGVAVGIGVGGPTVGVAVGIGVDVGGTVGTGVGTAVGSGVAVAVGTGVGATVGATAGTLVAVGTAVAVGCFVGTGVFVGIAGRVVAVAAGFDDSPVGVASAEASSSPPPQAPSARINTSIAMAMKYRRRPRILTSPKNSGVATKHSTLPSLYRFPTIKWDSNLWSDGPSTGASRPDYRLMESTLIQRESVFQFTR